MYYALPNPTVIDCGESLGMDPWMLHMLPARSRPYNSGSAYILSITYLAYSTSIGLTFHMMSANTSSLS